MVRNAHITSHYWIPLSSDYCCCNNIIGAHYSRNSFIEMTLKLAECCTLTPWLHILSLHASYSTITWAKSSGGQNCYFSAQGSLWHVLQRHRTPLEWRNDFLHAGWKKEKRSIFSDSRFVNEMWQLHVICMKIARMYSRGEATLGCALNTNDS